MAYRSISAAVSGTGTSASVAMPSGTVANDIIIVDVQSNDINSVTPASGFTQIVDIGAGSLASARGHITSFWKRAGSGEAGPYVFSWPSSATYEAVARSYSGRATSGDPFDGGVAAVTTVAGTTSGASPSTTVPGFTMSSSNTDIIGATIARLATSFISPSGYNERYDAGGKLANWDLPNQGPGATGDQTVGSSSTGFIKAWMGGLLAAGATPTLTPGTPTISGSATVGSTLTAATGTWTPTPDSYAYQWARGGVDISGATSSTYVVVVADEGSTLTVRVTGTKTGYTSASATSAATASVPVPTLNPGTPIISGTAAIGNNLSALTVGAWSPAADSYAFQWVRGSTDIAGATANNYTVTATDVGSTISLRVTGTKAGYNSANGTSAPTSTVPPGTITPGTPTVSGTAQVGSTLTAATGTWSPSPSSYAYQWRRGASDISGATSGTYAPIAADIGSALSVRVTGSKSGYTDATATSAGTTPVVSGVLTPGTPTIAGLASVGATLTGSTGSWTPAADSYAFQWVRGSTDIPGATSTTYSPVSGDVGSTISLRVTGSKAGYSSANATSAPTSAVISAPTLVPGTPTISGNPWVGTALEVVVGSAWSPSPDSYTYQWLRNGSSISGATSGTYVPTSADLGSTLSVRVTGSKAGYLSATATTAPTSVVTLSVFDVRQPVFFATAPATGAMIRLGKQWISTVAAGWGQPVLTYKWPGGNWEAKWTIPIRRLTRIPELAARQPVTVWMGGHCVWRGFMTEPDWDTGEMVAQGLVRLGEEALCLDNVGMTTSIPDVAIDQAIARGGLGWRRFASISSVAFGSTTATDRLNYLTALLDAYCNSANISWGVNSMGDVVASADPTTSRWAVYPDAGDFGTTDAALAGRLLGRYVNSAGVLNTIAVGSGFPEVGVDLATKLGPMDSTKATAILTGLLAKLGAQVGFTNSLVLTAEQITTIGGTAANLAQVRAGHRMTYRGLRDSRAVGLSTSVVLSETVWDIAEGTVQVTPKGMVGRDLGSIITDAGGIIL